MATANYQPTTELKDKTCLISGASRTLGAHIARRLAEYGAHVVINYHRSAEAAATLVQELVELGGQAVPIQADVSQPAEVERLVEHAVSQLGPIEILVNNVGPYVDTPFLDLPVADFDRIVAGNVRSTFLLSQLVGRQMKAQGHGQIINIAASDVYHRSHSIYGLAKSGVVYLTEALALELAPEVRINAIAPDLMADNEDLTGELAGTAIGGTPLGRLVTRAEVAEMVCLLCTSIFTGVTAQTIVMDGGRTIPRIATG